MNELDLFLSKLWSQYTSYTPSAERISQLFGEKVINDHIAFRTFNLPHCNVAKQREFLEQFGYKFGGDYFFEQKRLKAIHLENENPIYPKIFLSELMLEDFSEGLISVIKEISSDFNVENKENLFLGSRTWDINYDVYLKLAEESEYASWLYVWGFCPNHFTVSVNHLENYSEVQEVNDMLKDNGYVLNSSGGEIKGSQDDLLEQSSTMADKMEVDFDIELKPIPSCYYEFAKRYADKSGELYQGFVAKSADKIFESTNK